MMRIVQVLLLGFVLLLTGCATGSVVNHPYDTSLLQEFHQGVTTIADVKRVYGPPTTTLTNSQNGHTELVYAYSKVSGPVFWGNANVHHQGIVFVFDANGKMLYYRTSAGDSKVH